MAKAKPNSALIYNEILNLFARILSYFESNWMLLQYLLAKM